MSAYETRVRILALMAEQHLSAKDLAWRLGYTSERMSSVLGGRGPLTGSQVSAIAQVLDVAPEQLRPLARLPEDQPAPFAAWSR